MVLTAQRLRTALAAGGVLASLAGLPARSAAQAPTTPPPPSATPRVRSPRQDWQSAGRGWVGNAWIGVGLACSQCSYQGDAKTRRRWTFSAPPAVTMVDRGGPADQAGLRAGDSLTAVEGHALVSAAGGEAFANLEPGVAVRLTFRRDGRDQTVSVTPDENPTSRAHTAEELQARALARAWERARIDVQRELERTQGERQRAQRELQRALEGMRQNRGKFVLDSQSTQQMREALEQAQRAFEAQRSFAFTMPDVPPAVAPDVPEPPPEPDAPSGVTAPPAPGTPKIALRYAGRVGGAVIEARRPGRVTVVETGDSEVVLSGGDLSVRIVRDRRDLSAPPNAAGSVRSASGALLSGVQGIVVRGRVGAALGATAGVFVLDVIAASPAESLGVLPGDVVVSLDGSPAVSVVRDRVSSRDRAATTVRSVDVVRARERRTLTGGPPADTRARPRPPVTRSPRNP